METITVEVKNPMTISIPYFTKEGSSHFKVVSKDRCVWVASDRIVHAHQRVAFMHDWEQSTEQEFNEAFDRTEKNLREIAGL